MVEMLDWRTTIGSLFAAHQRRLISVVRKSVGNREIAADIVQDVFARALVAGPRSSLDDDRRVLYASARNAAIEHHRSERRRAELIASVLPEQVITPASSFEAGVQARQALAALDEALCKLSPRCREIFILRRVEGLSNQEIAWRHGISINSVEKHIARALRHCQSCLAEHLDQR